MKNFTLYSQGCCGSGTMIEFLKGLGLKRTAPKGYADGHVKYPPKHSEGNVLFVYGDPRDTLLSSIGRSDNNGFIASHCHFLGGDCIYLGDPYSKTTIEDMLADIYDPLRLEEHFRSWLNASINYKLMMLKYESLEDPSISQTVLEFFGVEGEYEYPWHERTSSYKKMSPDKQVQITDLFSDLLKIQDQLPSCFVR